VYGVPEQIFTLTLVSTETRRGSKLGAGKLFVLPCLASVAAPFRPFESLQGVNKENKQIPSNSPTNSVVLLPELVLGPCRFSFGGEEYIALFCSQLICIDGRIEHALQARHLNTRSTFETCICRGAAL
jgi:hypothetical protein